jgi:hypothetical protein
MYDKQVRLEISRPDRECFLRWLVPMFVGGIRRMMLEIPASPSVSDERGLTVPRYHRIAHCSHF